MQFTPPEIWKEHSVLLGIHTESSNTKISECLRVNLRTIQRIQKVLDESNGNYEGTAAQKPHSDEKKKTLPNLLEIQINKNPNMSIRFTARDMGVSEFPILQYFFYSNILKIL